MVKIKDMEDMKNIVVCLSRDRSFFSYMTYYLDGGGYTHASIALDEDSEYYYSFNFKGFKKEYRTSLKKRPREMVRYIVSVTEKQYDELKQILEDMEAHKEKYKYSRLGVSLCLFRVPNSGVGEDHYFCSQFVADVLNESGCLDTHKIPAMSTPNDLKVDLENSGKVIDISVESGMASITESVFDGALDKVDHIRKVHSEKTTKLFEALCEKASILEPLFDKFEENVNEGIDKVYDVSSKAISTVKKGTEKTSNTVSKNAKKIIEKGPQNY